MYPKMKNDDRGGDTSGGVAKGPGQMHGMGHKAPQANPDMGHAEGRKDPGQASGEMMPKDVPISRQGASTINSII